MTRRSHILLILLAMALMAFAGAGCVEPLRPYEKYGTVASVQLPIQINLPAAGGFVTKAISDGEVTGTANESALHSLQVWAFSHPLKAESAMTETEIADMLNEGSIAYISIPDVNVLERVDENMSVQVNLLIPDYYLNRPDEELRLDFYVLGNGESVGMGEAGVMKRGQLRDTVFQGSFFGLNTQEGQNFDGIPETGLPLACFFDNRGSGYDISFLKTDPKPTPARMEEMGRVWPEMELTRSVARMRFLFCKATGMSNTRIDSVKLYNYDSPLNVGIFPSKTYIFPREDGREGVIPFGADYESFTWGTVNSGLIRLIGEMDDPTILCSFSETMRNMSAQYYDTYVQTLVAAGSVTQKLAYLRESDLPVRGEIYYNGVRREGVLVTPSKVVTFDMVGLDFPTRTNFHRNHSWTVYGYMIGQHMEVDVRVDDWVVPWSEQHVTILDTATVNVDQDGKFITDAPMQADSLRYNDGVVKLKEPIEKGKPEKKWFNVPVPAGDSVTGRVVIYAPQNGILHVAAVPVDSVEFWPRLDPVTEGNNSDAAQYFDISLTRNVISRAIDPNSQIPGLIGITVKRKGSPTAKKAIKLTFTIEMPSGQLIAADSELIDDEYHFVFDPMMP